MEKTISFERHPRFFCDPGLYATAKMGIPECFKIDQQVNKSTCREESPMSDYILDKYEDDTYSSFETEEDLNLWSTRITTEDDYYYGPVEKIEQVLSIVGIFSVMQKVPPVFFPFKPSLLKSIKDDLYSKYGFVERLELPVIGHQMMDDYMFDNVDAFNHRDYLGCSREKTMIGVRSEMYRGMAIVFTVKFESGSHTYLWDERQIVEIPLGAPALYEMGQDFYLDIRNCEIYSVLAGRRVIQAEWQYFNAPLKINFFRDAMVQVSGLEYKTNGNKMAALKPVRDGMVSADSDEIIVRKREKSNAIYNFNTDLPELVARDTNLISTQQEVEEKREGMLTSRLEEIQVYTGAEDEEVMNKLGNCLPLCFKDNIECERIIHPRKILSATDEWEWKRKHLYNMYYSSSFKSRGLGNYDTTKRPLLYVPRTRVILISLGQGNLCSNVPIDRSQIVLFRYGPGDYSSYSNMKRKNGYCMYVKYGGTG